MKRIGSGNGNLAHELAVRIWYDVCDRGVYQQQLAAVRRISSHHYMEIVLFNVLPLNICMCYFLGFFFCLGSFHLFIKVQLRSP